MKTKMGRPPLLTSFALALFTALVMDSTAASDVPQQRLRIMTWNIHHGEGSDGKIDLQRIAKLIRSQSVDLVALQEVDKGVARTDRRDLPAELAALTKMEYVFSNNFAFQGGEYGNAILSRLPIRSSTNTHLRMLRPGEQRGILETTVDWGSRSLRFFSTHIDHRRDDAERLVNVEEFKRLVEDTDTSLVIIAGDFNDFPGSRVHQRMSESFVDAWEAAGEGDGFTFSSDRPRSRIDYIWLLKGSPLKTTGLSIPETAASDHLPLIAEFIYEP